MRYFVIGPDGSEFGPADIVLLNQWIVEGRIERQTNLRAESDGGLIRAAMLPALSFPPEPQSSPAIPQVQTNAAEPTAQPADAPSSSWRAQTTTSPSSTWRSQDPGSPSGGSLQPSPDSPMGSGAPRQAPPAPGVPYTPMQPPVPGAPMPYGSVTPRTPQPRPRMKFGIGIVIAVVFILLKGLPLIYALFRFGR